MHVRPENWTGEKQSYDKVFQNKNNASTVQNSKGQGTSITN